MRIAMLHSRYSSAVPSGENAVVDAEVAALARAGVDVRLFQTDPESIRARRSYPLTAAARVMSGWGEAFAEEVLDFRPDVVHVHNVFPDLGERSVSRLGPRLVVSVHNYRWMCAAGTFFRDGRICTDCVSRSTFEAVRHGCFHGRAGSVPLAVAHRGGASANPLVEAATEVWSPSEFHAAKLVEHGLDATKVRVSEHFLPAVLTPSPQLDRERSGFLFVGRLEAEKGILPLVEAWPVAGPPLTIIGDGDLRDEVKARSVGKPVELRGLMPRAQVVAHMQSARALVVASAWWETFGLVAIEALAAGTPLISIGEHAVSDLVSRLQAGERVSHVSYLGEAIRTIERRTSARWAEQVRALFDARFSEDAWSRRRVDEYSRVART